MGEVEVEGRSFQVPVRNGNLLFDSVQNLKMGEEKRMIQSFYFFIQKVKNKWLEWKQ